MQFHLNGFRPGDPDVAEAAPGAGARVLPDKVDAPIVGAGHDMHEMRGLDRARGYVVIVRPDEFLAEVPPPGVEGPSLAAFFGLAPTPVG